MEKVNPSRVFNTDETALDLNPVPPSVLAAKGSKQIYAIVNNNER